MAIHLNSEVTAPYLWHTRDQRHQFSAWSWYQCKLCQYDGTIHATDWRDSQRRKNSSPPAPDAPASPPAPAV